MIKRTTKGGKSAYKVVSKTGRPMGTYRTRAQAEKRLAQIEMFKSIKKSGSKRK